MDDEASYGPVVELLQRLAPVAADAGIVLDSNRPSVLKISQTDGMVANPNVRIYWDVTGVDSVAHRTEWLKGIETLGGLICQQNLKNGNKLMEEPGLIDWTKTLPAFEASSYQGRLG